MYVCGYLNVSIIGSVIAKACVKVNVLTSWLLVCLDCCVSWCFYVCLFVCVVSLCLCSTSPPGGNQVDGLPPASSFPPINDYYGVLCVYFQI